VKQHLESGLEERRDSILKLVDLVCVGVSSDDVMAYMGEGYTGHQADMTCTNHSDPHLSTPVFPLLPLAPRRSDLLLQELEEMPSQARRQA
jgi:hypothetical protein